jgi:hypothetical protein
MTESAPLRIRLELARVRIGSRDLSLTTLIPPTIRSTEALAADARSQRVTMPEIRAEGSRFFFRDVAAEIELVPLPNAETTDVSAGVGYRLTSAEAPSDGAEPSAETSPIARRVGSGDFTEWITMGPEGLERTMRVVRSGAPRWRVAAVRDLESKEIAAFEYDSEGRLSRIVTSAGVEWEFDYRRPTRNAAADLAQITARTSESAGAEMLFRAHLEYDEDEDPTPRLSRVMAASRAPAGVTDLSFVYETEERAAPGASDAAERLREIRTPRGEIEPRFEYDGVGPLLVVSAVPAEDAYDVRYPVTVRLAAEYVGEDILEDSLGRRTLAFDAAGRGRFRLHVVKGLLVQADGTPLDTGGAPFLVVLAPDGELYAGSGDYSSDSKLHHSSFLAGAEVAAAGEVVVHEGKVVRITSRSGHYKPPMCLLDQLSAELVRRGVELDGVPFEKGY